VAPVPSAVNLLDRLRGAFEPNVILEASAFVCEDPYKTQRALEGIVPALLLALLNRFTGPALLGLLVGKAEEESRLATAILGSQSAQMAELIAAEAGIQQASASSLVALAAPRVVRALRQVQSERNLGATALNAVLVGHRKRLARLLPENVAEGLKSWL
jgi:Bacterial protein of unknown function (DUF937)